MYRGLFLAVAGLLVLGCSGAKPATKHEAPARITNPIKESALTTVILTEAAQRRVGIELGTVERRRVARTRRLGGELTVPPGRTLVVAAPHAGTIVGSTAPLAGRRVRRGELLLKLLALPPESDALRAEEDAGTAEARVENARIRAMRAEELLRTNAGSVEARDDAKSELASAEAAARAAKARLRLVTQGTSGGEHALAGLTPITLSSPTDGLVRQVFASPGQVVAAGTALVEIIAPDPLWIRVPVYAGDLHHIDTARPATMRNLGENGAGGGLSIRPVAAPPSADALASSVNLFFELPNREHRYRPGERVSVQLDLRGASAETLVVPHAAVVHDLHGDAWVYEAGKDGAFVRRRVVVREVRDGFAALEHGPAPTTRIVTTGAAELFSTEFGLAK